MGAVAAVTDAALRERLAHFYAEHWRKLWAYVARIGADPATAQDIAQDSFARWALSPAPAWEDRRARAYLYAIAHRALGDHRRRSGRETMLDEDEPGPAQGPADFPLARVWSRLKARERHLLWLAYAEEFSHEEIAEITGLGAASVRVVLSRAREKARILLAGETK
jgi:RNA polymerase sigma-70 factor (ECF subfamily)